MGNRIEIFSRGRFRRPTGIEPMRALERMRVDAIPSGTHFPLTKMEEHLPSNQDLIIVDAGCGNGQKLFDRVERLEADNFSIGAAYGFDVNHQAIEAANGQNTQSKLSFLVGDVTEERMSRVYGLNGRVDVILCEGLFSNLPGNFANEAAYNLANMLKPGGILCVADCLRADVEPARQLVTEHFSENNRRFDFGMVFPEISAWIWQAWWKWRYSRNDMFWRNYQRVLTPQLRQMSSGAFLVFPPGLDKQWEYGPEFLLEIYLAQHRVERIARHYLPEEIVGIIRDEGGLPLLLNTWEDQLWLSRQNVPINGFSAVFRKPYEKRRLAARI